MNRYIISHVEDLRELLMVAEWRRHNRGADENFPLGCQWGKRFFPR